MKDEKLIVKYNNEIAGFIIGLCENPNAEPGYILFTAKKMMLNNYKTEIWNRARKFTVEIIVDNKLIKIIDGATCQFCISSIGCSEYIVYDNIHFKAEHIYDERQIKLKAFW